MFILFKTNHIKCNLTRTTFTQSKTFGTSHTHTYRQIIIYICWFDILIIYTVYLQVNYKEYIYNIQYETTKFEPWV
jgi:hypothetical protein